MPAYQNMPNILVLAQWLAASWEHFNAACMVWWPRVRSRF